MTSSLSLNEVQFQKELRRGVITSRVRRWTGLNEVQFPKELRREVAGMTAVGWLGASMKCSSRRNCDIALPLVAMVAFKPQ